MSNRVFGTAGRRAGGKLKVLQLALLAGTAALVMIPRAEAAGEIIDLTDPYDIYFFQRITALSANGGMYVGNIYDRVNTLYTAYHVSGQGGASSVPGFGGGASRAFGMSGDGQWVVGRSRHINDHERPFLWNVETGAIHDLGLLYPDIPNAHSTAYDVSGDGTRVVGEYSRAGILRGFAWIKDATTGQVDNEQMYQLSGLDDADVWSAITISDDGRYAAGFSNGNATTEIAVRWDLSGLEAGGVGADVALNLGSLTDDQVGSSRSLDISGDGRVVVGWSYDADGIRRAFRWVEGATGGVVHNVQMYNLGVLEGASGSMGSQANAVTRDGNVVVGWSEWDEDGDTLAFRWTEETGMETVSDWLARHGVDTSSFATLTDATAVSDDGRVIAGMMTKSDFSSAAFIARVSDEPGGGGGGMMDVAEYQATLYAGAGGVADAGEFLTWLPLNGAHHRPLMMTPDLSGDMCAWATGDFAQHGWSSTDLALAEAGACVDLAGGSVRFGGAVGASSSWQDFALGGSSRLTGQYVLSEIDWQPNGTPLLVSLTGMLGSWQADIDRAYSNGGAVAISSGETQVTGGVVRLRADWLGAAQLGNTSINPYVSASLGHLHVDGYSESGGPFPASFDAQDLTHGEVRLGVTAITELSAQTKLSSTFEVAHRSGTAAAAVGQVDGLFGFSLGGGSYGQTWLRAGLELDHKINDQLSLSGSVHAASYGRDPSVAVSAGIKGAF